MLAIPESHRKAWLLLGSTLAVLMSLWTVVRLMRQDMFSSIPLRALTVFLTPVAISCVLGLLRRTPLARNLLLGGILAFLLWITSFAALAALALLALASLSIGGALARVGGLEDGTGPLATVFALTLGLAALALVLTLASHFPVNGPIVYAASLFAAAVAGWRRLARHASTWYRWLADEERVGLTSWLGAGLFIGAVLLNVCYAGLFGFSPDTLAMHLYIPSYMATYGRWSYDFQGYLWALEPIASDLLFGVTYMLSDAIGAQLLNAACTLLTAALIYSVCRRRSDTFDSLLPATAWLCTSYILYLSGSLHAEGFLTLLLFAAFVHLDGLESTAPSPWRAGLVSGVLIAAAVATKVLALLLGPVFAAFLLLVPGRRHGLAWTWRFALTVGIVLLVAGGFQYAYAYAETGNPVFFFYNGLFQSPFYRPVNFLDDRWIGHYDWGLPFDLSFNTQHFSEVGPGGAGFQWFMLLPTALICLLFRDTGRARWFGFAGLWFAAVALSPLQYLRYMLPALPFLAVLVAEVGVQPGRVVRGIYRACMLVAIGLNLIALRGSLLRLDDLPTERLFSREGRDAYLQEQAPEIAANRLIDGLETAPVNVLYVSRSWGAELKGTAYYQSWYNPGLNEAFRRLRTADGLGPLLAANHIRYVIVNPSYKHVIKAEQTVAYCRVHGVLVATLGDVSVYRLDGVSP